MFKKILSYLSRTTFEKLSKKEKRVSICKDVIAQVKAKRLLLNVGSIFKKDESYLNYIRLKDSNDSCKNILNDLTCTVCAKGAIMLGYIDKHNNFSINRLESADYRLNHDRYPKDLIEIFGRKLLDDIEMSFEGTFFQWHIDNYSYDTLSLRDLNTTPALSEKAKMITAFTKYENDNERIIAIMKNIIDNKGELLV